MAELQITTHTTRYGHPIAADQKSLEPFLQGPPGSEHFFVEQGEVYCVRATCEGCRIREGCEFVDTKITLCFNPTTKQPLAQPHPRRGVGFEQTKFYPLAQNTGVSEHQLVDAGVPAYHLPWLRDEENFTAMLDPIPHRPSDMPLRVVHSMLRWYGTEDEYRAHPISALTKILPPFTPGETSIYALDFSSIEPLVNTIVTREPSWLQAFNGYEKEALREIALDDDFLPPLHTIDISHNQLSNPDPGHTSGTSYHICYLNGELDKTDFEGQCGKCPVCSHCRTITSITKTAKESWHDINLRFLYADKTGEWQKADGSFDAAAFKYYRSITKIVGLAITYGGTAWTVSANMSETVEQADVRVQGFLSRLPVFRYYMGVEQAKVLQTGQVFNIFGRRRDVRKDSHPDASLPYKDQKKRQSYAQRTALNHPIQSSAAEILKIVTNRVSNWIKRTGVNPLAGNKIPVKIDITAPPPTEVATFLSVHDETDYLIRNEGRDTNLAEIYRLSQLSDILEKFKVPFVIELDIEYDGTSTWTGKIPYPAARVYATWHAQERSGHAEKVTNGQVNGVTYTNGNSGGKTDPGHDGGLHILSQSHIELEYEKTPQKFLDELGVFVADDHVLASGQVLPLVLKSSRTGQMFKYMKPIPINLVRDRGVPYRLIKD